MTDQQKAYYFSLWEKDFYDKYAEDRSLENEDFRSIAIGFFIASGLEIGTSIEMYNHCISQNKY